MPARTVYITIEGIGEDVGKEDGFAIYAGRKPTTLTDHELMAGLIDVPSGIVSEARPLLGQSRLAPYKFKLRRTDQLAKALQSPQPEPTYTLTAALTSGAATMSVTPAITGAPRPVWIGNEVLRAGNNSSSPGILRGRFGTQAESHDAGAFVSTRPSWHRFRKIELYLIEDGGSSKRIWTGYVDKITGGDDGTTITVHGTEAPATVSKMKANRFARRFQGSEDVYLGSWSNGDRENDANAFINGSVTDPLALTPGGSPVSSVHKPGEAPNLPTAIQIGEDTLTVGIVRGAKEIEFQQFPSFEGSYFVFDDDNAGAFAGFGSSRYAITEPMYEVGVISQEMDEYLERYSLEKVSFTRDLDYPYHPLSIIAALTCSTNASTKDVATYDVVNGDFGIYLIPFAEGSYISNLTTLIEETRDLKVKRAFFGLGGEPYKLFEELVKLARAFGFFQTFDESGRMGWRRFGLASVEDYDNALSNKVKVRLGDSGQPLIGWDSAYEETYSNFYANVGETPWNEGVPVRVNIDGVETRAEQYGPADAFKIDYPYVPPGDAFELKETFVNAALLLHFKMPRFRIRVEDRLVESLDYDMGSLVTLDTLPIRDGTTLKGWLLDSATGETTTDSDDIQFAGRIIGRGASLQDGTYELRVLLTNYSVGKFVRWRAPAMQVASYVDNGDGTYDLTSAASSQFGYDESDSQAFYVGDDLQLVDRDLTTIATSPFSVDSQPTTTSMRVADLGVDPTDKFVRLVNYDSYSNASIFTNIAVAWAAFADASQTLGTSDDESDIYG